MQHQPAWVAEVAYLGHRFLPEVAALVHGHGLAHAALEGKVVGQRIDAEARDAGGNPPNLEGVRGRLGEVAGQRPAHRLEVVTRREQVAAGARAGRHRERSRCAGR